MGRHYLLLTLALLGCEPSRVYAQADAGARSDATARGYPNRPIRFIVSFPPGGAADTLARVLGQKLGETLPQQVVIDNRAGAGGNLAAEIAAKAAPDGYTLLQTTVGHAISASLYKKLPYDLKRDFAAVTGLASTPFLLVAKPLLPVASVMDLVALARAKPGLLNYASSGNGGPSHLAMEMFKSAARIDARHIPYKGAAQTVTDLIGGQVDLLFSTPIAALPSVHSGKLRALGIGSLKRSPLAPDIPTIDESGVKGFEASTWFGVQVPAGTPQPIVNRLHGELVSILRRPDISERLVNQGFDLVGNSPAEFADYLGVEIAKWAHAVRQSGARID